MVAQDMAPALYEAPAAPARGRGLILPIARPEDVRQAMREYEAMKRAILEPAHDVVRIGDKDAIKRTGWDKIARAFGISVEPVREEYVTRNGDWGYLVIVRALAPNGDSMIGDGACFAEEKRVHPKLKDGAREPSEAAVRFADAKSREAMTDHNVRAHAYTRATNRAISNLVGGGEVSAEELQRYDAAPPDSGHNGDQGAQAERRALPPGRQQAPAAKPPAPAPAAPVTEDEMAAMTARFKAVGLGRPQVETFVRAQCGDDKGYNKGLTRADWTKIDAALKTYEAKMARLTGASGTVAEAAKAVTSADADYLASTQPFGDVIDADPPAPDVLDLTGEAEDEQGA